MFQKEKFLVLIFSDKIYIFALFFIFPYILPSNFALALALFFALVFRAKKRARARAKFEGKIYGKMKKRAKKRAKPETTRMPLYSHASILTCHTIHGTINPNKLFQTTSFHSYASTIYIKNLCSNCRYFHLIILFLSNYARDLFLNGQRLFGRVYTFLDVFLEDDKLAKPHIFFVHHIYFHILVSAGRLFPPQKY